MKKVASHWLTRLTAVCVVAVFAFHIGKSRKPDIKNSYNEPSLSMRQLDSALAEQKHSMEFCRLLDAGMKVYDSLRHIRQINKLENEVSLLREQLYSSQLEMLETTYASLEVTKTSLIEELKFYKWGKEAGADDGKVAMMMAILNAHRFRGVTDQKQKEEIIAAEKKFRDTLMVANWQKSLEHLHDLLPDWELLDTLVRISRQARVLSIMEADTIGYPSFVTPSVLSVIPLKMEEYLVCRGKAEEAGGYYAPSANMIVLRHDLFDTAVCEYSYWNAILYFHELYHYHLTVSGFSGDADAQHLVIRKAEDEAYTRLFQSYTKKGYDGWRAIDLFEENANWLGYYSSWQKIDSLHTVWPKGPFAILKAGEIIKLRKQRSLLFEKQYAYYQAILKEDD